MEERKSYDQAAIDAMTPDQRSAAWAGADDASRGALHAANVRDKSATHDYNETTGVWTPKAAPATPTAQLVTMPQTAATPPAQPVTMPQTAATPPAQLVTMPDPAAPASATPAPYTPTGTHLDASLTDAERAKVKEYQDQYNQVKQAALAAGVSPNDPEVARQLDSIHAAAEAIRAQASSGAYSGGLDGSEYIASNQQTRSWGKDLSNPAVDPINHIDADPIRRAMSQIVEAQKAQSDMRINYATDNAVNELTRALEDADKQFQTQRNQVSADEATARDNQALYAEMRGDKGGIGAAQYDAVANTAAVNRLAVNQAQVKLSTDTQRQIADLRAKGEFEKADALLSITQAHLAQLMQLEQWAIETNLGVDEFNAQLQKWQAEYNLSAQQYLTNTELSTAQLTGMFADGTKTLAAENALREQLASAGATMLGMGIMPSASQLDAMGFTAEQAQVYLETARAQAEAKKGGVNPVVDDTFATFFEDMEAAGIADLAHAMAWLQSNAKKYNIPDEMVEEYAGMYMDLLDDSTGGPGGNSYAKLAAGAGGKNFVEAYNRVAAMKHGGKAANGDYRSMLDRYYGSGGLTYEGLAFIMRQFGIGE